MPLLVPPSGVLERVHALAKEIVSSEALASHDDATKTMEAARELLEAATVRWCEVRTRLHLKSKVRRSALCCARPRGTQSAVHQDAALETWKHAAAHLLKAHNRCRFAAHSKLAGLGEEAYELVAPELPLLPTDCGRMRCPVHAPSIWRASKLREYGSPPSSTHLDTEVTRATGLARHAHLYWEYVGPRVSWPLPCTVASNQAIETEDVVSATRLRKCAHRSPLDGDSKFQSNQQGSHDDDDDDDEGDDSGDSDSDSERGREDDTKPDTSVTWPQDARAASEQIRELIRGDFETVQAYVELRGPSAMDYVRMAPAFQTSECVTDLHCSNVWPSCSKESALQSQRPVPLSVSEAKQMDTRDPHSEETSSASPAADAASAPSSFLANQTKITGARRVWTGAHALVAIAHVLDERKRYHTREKRTAERVVSSVLQNMRVAQSNPNAIVVCRVRAIRLHNAHPSVSSPSHQPPRSASPSHMSATVVTLSGTSSVSLGDEARGAQGPVVSACETRSKTSASSFFRRAADVTQADLRSDAPPCMWVAVTSSDSLFSPRDLEYQCNRLEQLHAKNLAEQHQSEYCEARLHDAPHLLLTWMCALIVAVHLRASGGRGTVPLSYSRPAIRSLSETRAFFRQALKRQWFFSEEDIQFSRQLAETLPQSEPLRFLMTYPRKQARARAATAFALSPTAAIPAAAAAAASAQRPLRDGVDSSSSTEERLQVFARNCQAEMNKYVRKARESVVLSGEAFEAAKTRMLVEYESTGPLTGKWCWLRLHSSAHVAVKPGDLVVACRSDIRFASRQLYVRPKHFKRTETAPSSNVASIVLRRKMLTCCDVRQKASRTSSLCSSATRDAEPSVSERKFASVCCSGTSSVVAQKTFESGAPSLTTSREPSIHRATGTPGSIMETCAYCSIGHSVQEPNTVVGAWPECGVAMPISWYNALQSLHHMDVNETNAALERDSPPSLQSSVYRRLILEYLGYTAPRVGDDLSRYVDMGTEEWLPDPSAYPGKHKCACVDCLDSISTSDVELRTLKARLEAYDASQVRIDFG